MVGTFALVLLFTSIYEISCFMLLSLVVALISGLYYKCL
jgi:hypothetical protein